MMDLQSITRVQMMKVELNGPTAGATLDAVTSAQANKPEISGENAVQTPEEDNVTLSTDTSSIAALTTKAMTSPEIRQDKVDALRQAIANGDYKVDPGQIAKAMIADSE